MMYYELKNLTYSGLTIEEYNCLNDIFRQNSFPNEYTFVSFLENVASALRVNKVWLIKKLSTSEEARSRFVTLWGYYEEVHKNTLRR